MVQLRDGTKVSELVNAEEGIISPRIFSDEEIYQLEMEKIFSKVWNFVAHETEIPNPGDFVTRYVGNDRVIVVREEDGNINVFLNVCMHKGMHLCRTDNGNAKTFKCIYHGWVYNTKGTVIGAPAAKDAYRGLFDKGQFQLTQARVEIFAGLVFATFNEEAPSLDEWLGDAKFYLDLYFNKTGKGMTVIGEPIRWVINANWKTAADNFASDSYHTLMTHYSGVALGKLPPDPMFASYGHQIALENGHGFGIVQGPPIPGMPEFMNYPKEIVEQAKKKLSPEQIEVFRKSSFVPGNIFPNMSILNVMEAPGLDENEGFDAFVPYMTIRLWQPRGPHELELFSFFLIDKDVSEEFKEKSRLGYLMQFGTSGMFEADDAEIWTGVTRVTQGTIARKQLQLRYVMGLNAEYPEVNWPGPGRATPTTYTEANSRNFFGQWAKMMSQE